MHRHTVPLLRTRLQALFVTFLWSTSWVLIKMGLDEIPALTFAGLRYTLAFLCMLPIVFWSARRQPLPRLSLRAWLRLAALGLLLYSVTQGAQFLSLVYLPAATLNLLLSFSTTIVAMLGVLALRERPTPWQWGGIGIYLVGVWLYFAPAALPRTQLLGLVIGLIALFANAFSALLGRAINRTQELSALQITVISMGIGALVLLLAGIVGQGLPRLSLANWLIVVWLATVNTAFAFTLWNHTLRRLPAMESSILNSTMLIQIPILAWIFLDERLNVYEVLGLVIAGVGILVVQLHGHRQKEEAA